MVDGTPLHQFVKALLEDGHLRLAREELGDASTDAETSKLIRAIEQITRQELAGEPPVLCVQDAEWALHWLYDACRFLAYRDFDVQAIEVRFAKPCPHVPSSSTCYSVDLFLKYLPDVVRLARGVGEDDPLVAEMLKVAQAWPLSSVGITGVEPTEESLRAIFADACLKQLLIDRVIERAAKAWARVPIVADGIAAAIGGQTALALPLAECEKGLTA